MATKIDKKIVGYKVLTPGTTPVNQPSIEMKPKLPLERPFKLSSCTYKIKPTRIGNNDSFYITITDQTTVDDDGINIKPFEIFINSKNVEHLEYITLITRLTSAIFRTVDDPRFVVEEFRSIYSPLGAYNSPPRSKGEKGHIYKSILDEIGEVIDLHFDDIRIRKVKLKALKPSTETQIYDKETFDEIVGKVAETLSATKSTVEEWAENNKQTKAVCPSCSEPALVRMDGCDTCTSCGFSKCS